MDGCSSQEPPSPHWAVSPDGRRLVFEARARDGKSLLVVRSLDAVAAQSLAGTDGAQRPFWSPDGRFIGFFADGKLKKIDVTGGPPVTVCDTAGAIGSAAWSPTGVIVFSRSN